LIECLPLGYMCDRILYGEAHFYQGVLILHQGYHDDYVSTLVELLCHAMMGWVLVLECMLSGVHGLPENPRAG
jgi:hypothetical protein